MINHHPKFELIQSFVNGDLPASMSAAITIHASLCPSCQSKISQLTEQVAEAVFENEGDSNTFIASTVIREVQSVSDQSSDDLDDFDFDDMINSITESSDIDVIQPVIDKTIEFKNISYDLPKPLNNIVIGKTAKIGNLSRARLMLDEDEIRTSLLHIAPGGSVPEHTHNGFELTVLLDGSFSDEKGHYEKGDFIMLDASHQHQPFSQEGCLCYTVANDSLHFTQGINKLLNPIGSFIY